MRKLDDPAVSKTSSHEQQQQSQQSLALHHQRMSSALDLPTPPAVSMVKSAGPVAPMSMYTSSAGSTSATSSYYEPHSSRTTALSSSAATDAHYSSPSASASSSSFASGVTTISLAGGKAGPITISERNPFRGLVGSMNAAAAEAEAEFYSSTTAKSTYSAPKATVTASSSWLSSSSGSTAGSAGGRLLPSTQSATRTISTYSAAANGVVSQMKVPPGSTGPTPRSSSSTSTTESTWNAGAGAIATASSYRYTSEYGTSAAGISLSSTYHPTGASTDRSSDLRVNHISEYEPSVSSTSSRPYYSSYLNSTATSSAIASSYNTSSTAPSALPLAERSVSPSRRTTISCSYLSSSSSAGNMDPIYSTVNKTVTGSSRTTDLFPTSVAGSTSYGRTTSALLDDDEDLPSYRTNYGASSSGPYGSNLASAGAATSTTSSYSSSSWSTSDATSGIGSGGSATRYGRSSYISDYSSPTSTALTNSDATTFSKPLIGSGTQLYPSKFSSGTVSGSSVGSNGGFTSTSSAVTSSTAYRSSYSNI